MDIYSDKALSQRLERAEASYNAAFVSARLQMFPDSRAEWIDVDGTYAMFDGVESPLTQTFGLGLFKTLSLDAIKALEEFYRRFSAPVFHEVSPMSDPSHMDLLFQNGYHPVELTSVLYKPLVKNHSANQSVNPEITTQQMRKGEEEMWASTSAKGWSTEAPDLYAFIHDFAHIAIRGEGVLSFFAHLEGKPISTGMLYMEQGIALLAGDSTVAEGRKRGAQNALINARLNYAADHGCTVAMLAASPNSQSQKNAEKKGFRLAYTRTKWKLGTV